MTILTKPGLVPLGVAWGCPFATGLQFLYAYNELLWTQIKEIISEQIITQQGGNSSPTMITDRLGQAYSQAQSSTTGSGYYVLLPLGGSFKYTVMCVFRFNATPGAQRGLMGANDTISGFGNVLTNASVSSRLRPVYQVNYGTTVSVQSPTPLDTDTPRAIIGLSRGSAAHELWIDGSLILSSSSSAGTSALNRNRAWAVGAGGTLLPAVYFMSAGWNRDLMPAEIAALSENPWQLFDWGLGL